MANETTTPQVTGKTNSKSTIPAADIDFGTVANNVATKWIATPTITLQWKTAAEHAAEASAYNTELSNRKQLGGGRPQITQSLQALDNQIDNALSYVKGYIADKYKKEAAPSYYTSFGILHQGKKYIMPKDRNKRLAALELMLTGIADNGFGDKEFGTAFWTDIKTQYETLVTQATTTDGTVSSKVSNKNVLKASLKKTLNSLISVIKGHYPDTYKAELRSWGFQKEKY